MDFVDDNILDRLLQAENVTRTMQIHVLRVCPTVPKLCPSRSNFSKNKQRKPKVDHTNPLNSSVLKHREFDISFTGTQNPPDLASVSVRFRPPAPVKSRG